MTFSDAFVLFDTEMQSGLTQLKFVMSRSYGDLAQRSLVSPRLQTSCPLKLLGQFQLNFICSLQANGERKLTYLVCST